jgi:hypothetical protein
VVPAVPTVLYRVISYPYLTFRVFPRRSQLFPKNNIMSLFDTLEHISTEDDSPLAIRDREESKEEKTPDFKKTSNTGGVPVKRQKATIQSENLSFLRPCPICHGRNFTYGNKGGFFCNTCQPGITGSPAYATGQDRLNVHAAEPTTTQSHVQNVSAQIRKTSQEAECFKIGFPWIMAHLEELLATGWTRPGLFRRSCHRWCIGNWGLAWAASWTRPGVKIAIEKSGRVSFTFTSGCRTITQAAYPVKMCKKRG